MGKGSTRRRHAEVTGSEPVCRGSYSKVFVAARDHRRQQHRRVPGMIATSTRTPPARHRGPSRASLPACTKRPQRLVSRGALPTIVSFILHKWQFADDGQPSRGNRRFARPSEGTPQLSCAWRYTAATPAVKPRGEGRYVTTHDRSSSAPRVVEPRRLERAFASRGPSRSSRRLDDVPKSQPEGRAHRTTAVWQGADRSLCIVHSRGLRRQTESRLAFRLCRRTTSARVALV